MALNLDAIGEKIGPIERDYNWKDVVLYALGVGAGFHELHFVYEDRLKVIPSFSIASIFEFLAETAVKANVDLSGILHGEQDIIFHNPIPTEGKLITEGRVTHIYDKGKEKGALVMSEAVTRHSGGAEAVHQLLHPVLPQRRGIRRRAGAQLKHGNARARAGLRAPGPARSHPAPGLPPVRRYLRPARGPGLRQAQRVPEADHARAVHPRLCLPRG